MADAKVQLVIDVDTNGAVSVKQLSGSLADAERAAKKLGLTLKESVANEFLGAAERSGRLGGALANLTRSFATLEGFAGKAALGLGAVAGGVGLVTAALLRGGKSATDWAAGIKQLSDQALVTGERFQSLNVAFRSTGVDAPRLAQGLARLGENLGKARQGTGELVSALKDTDRAFLETIRRTGSTEKAFDLLVAKVASLKNPYDQLRVASAALGDDLGRKLLPALRKGPEALRELEHEARKSGQVVSNFALTISEKVDKAFQNFATTISTSVKQAFLSLAPVLLFIGEKIEWLAKKFAGLLSSIPALRDAVQDPRLAAFDQRADQLGRSWWTGGDFTRFNRNTARTNWLGLPDYTQQVSWDRIAAKRARLMSRRAGVASSLSDEAMAALGLGGDDTGPLAPIPTGGDGGGGGIDSFAKKVADLRRRIDELNGSITPTQAAVDDIVASFGEGGEAVRGLAEEYVRLKDSQDTSLASIQQRMEELKEPTVANIEAMGGLAAQLERMAQTDDVVRQLKTVRDRITELRSATARAGREMQENLEERLKDLIDPAGKAGREFDKMRKKALELGRTDLLPLVDQLEQVEAAAATLDRVFGELERGVSDVFEGLILGTSKVEDAFKQMAIAIVRSITEMLLSAAMDQFRAMLLSAVASYAGGGGGGGGFLSFLGGGGSIVGGGGGGGGTFGQILQLGTQMYGGGGGGGGLLGGFAAPSYYFSGGGGGGFTAPSYYFSGGGGGNTFSTFGGGDLLSSYLFGGGAAGMATFAGGAGALPIMTSNLAQFGAGQLFSAGGSTFMNVGGNVVEIAGVHSSFAPTEALTGGLGTGGSGAASGLSTLTSVVGLLLSLGLGAKGIADSRSSYNKVTLGTAQGKNNAFTAVQGGLLAGFTAGGAAIGSVVPGLGTIVGAGIGAAVGGALNSALSSSLTGGIASGLNKRAGKEGITQRQVDKDVSQSLRDNLVLKIIDIILNPASALGGDLGVGTLGEFIGGFFVPDVEKIIEKMARGALGSGGLNTAEIETSGRVSAEARELRGASMELSRVISVMIGGGTDPSGNRMNRISALFSNGVARQAMRSGEDGEQIMYRVFRRIFSSDLVEALKVAKVLPGVRSGTGDPAIRNRVLAAFEAGLPEGTDLDPIVDVVTERGRGFMWNKNQRKSREAVAQALPSLFEEGGLQNFQRSFSQVIRQAFTNGVTQAVVSGTFGNVMAGIFGFEKRTRRTLRRMGPTDEAFELIANDLDKSIREAQTFLKAGEPLFKKMAELADIERRAQVTYALSTGDTAAARNAIMEAIGPIVQIAENFRALVDNVEARVAVGINGNGLAGQKAQLRVLERQAGRAESQLLSVAGVGSIEQVQNSDVLKNNLSQAYELLQQYADAQLTYLEQSLALAERQKAVWEGFQKTFQGFQDQVAVIRGRGFAQGQLVGRDQAEIQSLLGKALGGDEEATGRIAELLPNVLNFAQTLAPGSAAQQAYLDFVDQISTSLGIEAGEQVDQAAQAVDDLKGKFETFSTTVVPLLQGYADFAKNQLAQHFNDVVDALGTQGELYRILVAIGQELGVPTSQLTPNTGPGGERPFSDSTPLERGYTATAVMTGQGIALDFGKAGGEVGRISASDIGVGGTWRGEGEDAVFQANWTNIQKAPPVWAYLDLTQDAIQLWAGNPPGPAGGPGQSGESLGSVALRANGGLSNAAGMYLIGERGPEWLMTGGASPAYVSHQRDLAWQVPGGSDGNMGEVAAILRALMAQASSWRSTQEEWATRALVALEDERGGGGDIHLHVDGQPVTAIARQLARGLGTGTLSELRYELERLARSAR